MYVGSYSIAALQSAIAWEGDGDNKRLLSRVDEDEMNEMNKDIDRS